MSYSHQRKKIQTFLKKDSDNYLRVPDGQIDVCRAESVQRPNCNILDPLPCDSQSPQSGGVGGGEVVAHQRVLHLNLNLLQSLKVAEDPAGVNERNLGEVWKKREKTLKCTLLCQVEVPRYLW